MFELKMLEKKEKRPVRPPVDARFMSEELMKKDVVEEIDRLGF